jgi:hypothetical protein
LDEGHQDFGRLGVIRDAILSRCGGEAALNRALPEIVADAVDYVVDPVRTARTLISDLDNVEKTYIGLKIEHFLRDFLDFPKGIRDLNINGIDVDVKNTVSKTWMIPPETFRNMEPCLLIQTETSQRYCSMGLIIAHEDYLNKPNRDGKRSVSAPAFANILWLVDKVPLPESRWANIDMTRFRDLRRIKGGSIRAAAFFRENLGLAVHRSIVQGLLFDQLDYMKRIRGNQGARDILYTENIAILSGSFNKEAIGYFNLPQCSRDEFISVRYSQEQKRILDQTGYFQKKSDGHIAPG